MSVSGEGICPPLGRFSCPLTLLRVSVSEKRVASHKDWPLRPDRGRHGVMFGRLMNTGDSTGATERMKAETGTTFLRGDHKGVGFVEATVGQAVRGGPEADLRLPEEAPHSRGVHSQRTPSNLVDLAVQAHGGLERWAQYSRFRVSASITGAIWTMKAVAGLLDDVVLEGDIRDQRVTITPFPKSGEYATWEPSRQSIETAEGIVLQERLNPAASFVGQVRQTPWDDLQAAYFASEANWNYFVAPFIFTRSDFITTEIAPWREDGQWWRRLLVTYPDSVVAHCRQQTYYFDDAGLLRRLDYSVDILGGGPAVHYPSEYCEFDGVMVPTKRLVYVRNADGTPQLESVSIAIEFSQVDLS